MKHTVNSRRSILVFIFCLLPSFIWAQQDYKQFYTLENLLSKELIKSVAKDQDGYVWIATDDGILQYDGYQTQLFFKELPTHYTKGFLKRRNGQFYVLSDNGIKEIIKKNDSIIFKPLTIGEKVYDDQLNYPKAAYEDLDNNLWVAEVSGLIRYSKNGVKHFDLGEEFRSIDYHRSFTFAEDAFGNLWIAPFKGPLLFYDKHTQKLVHINLTQRVSDVTGITSVKGDYLFMGGKEGILRVKIDSDHTILESKLMTDVKDISIIKCFTDNDIYIGTWTQGLFEYDFANPGAGVTKIQNIPINDILDLYVDPTKSELWVAGSESVGLFKPSIVSTIYQAGENRIESIALDKQNHVYYSIGKKVFYLENIVGAKPENILSVDDTYFARILIDDTKLWIGDAFGKVLYYDLIQKRKHYLVTLTDISIQYIYKDHLENKWFTGHNKGLIKVDAREQVKFYSALTRSVVTRESKNGALFCAQNTRKNLISRYDQQHDTFTPVKLSFGFDCSENIIVNDFQFDAQDNMWLGTNEGLLKIENEKGAYKIAKRFAVAGQNEEEPVRALAITDNYICFANASGLIIYKDGDYIIFNQDSGLPSKILKDRGLTFDNAGNLLVSTAKGMAFLEKDAIRFEPTLKPIIKTFLVNGVPLSMDELKTETLPYKTKLEAEFISLSFPASNILYQTRIQGIDKDWSSPSVSRTISVLGFSEGSYRLEVRAREDGKLWSEPLTLTFEIAKPWYRTWWSLLLFIGCGVAVIMMATTLHNNNLIRQKRNLKRTVEERTEEIDRQKNEMIEQQKKIIQQKEEIIAKNEAVYKSQQALNEADMNYLHLKEKQLQDQIDYKNKQITTHTLNILQKNESLTELRKQLEDVVKNAGKISIVDIKKTLKTIDESFKLDKDWDDFKLYFEQIHTGFYAKLKISYPDLTPLELRHCALIRLNLTLAECASILGISNDSLKVSRTRLRKKLNLSANQSLTDFIIEV